MTIKKLIILVLICQSACGQNIVSNSIAMSINDDSLFCTLPCKTVTVSFTLSNDSGNNILIYGLRNGGPRPAFSDLSGLSDIKRTGTGALFVLYRQDGAQEMAEFEIGDPIVRRPVSKKVIDSEMY